MIRFFLPLVVTLCCWTQSVRSQELPESLKAKVDAMITAELDKGAFPGASVAIGTRNGIFYLKSYGYHDYSKRLPVRNDDVFDVASCTKVLSTTFAAMRLFDQGRLRTLPARTGRVAHLRYYPRGVVDPHFRNACTGTLFAFRT